MTHVGVAIRVLRAGAGLSLRDLADRIGVSKAYLSRIENGLDAPPTDERLESIARELGVASALLFDIAGRTSPLVAAYVETVPSAAALFSDIARRNVDARGVKRLRDLLDGDELVARSQAPVAFDGTASLARCLTPERVVVGLDAGRLGDVLDVVAARLGDGSGAGIASLARELKAHERDAPTALGDGVVVPQVFVPGPPLAALVTLARPIKIDAPDRTPARVVVGLRSPDRGWAHLSVLAQTARLARFHLADRLAAARTGAEVVELVAGLEALV